MSSVATSRISDSRVCTEAGEKRSLINRRYSRCRGGSTSSGASLGKGVSGRLAPCSAVENRAQSRPASQRSLYLETTQKPPWHSLHATGSRDRSSRKVGYGSAASELLKWSYVLPIPGPSSGSEISGCTTLLFPNDVAKPIRDRPFTFRHGAGRHSEERLHRDGHWAHTCLVAVLPRVKAWWWWLPRRSRSGDGPYREGGLRRLGRGADCPDFGGIFPAAISTRWREDPDQTEGLVVGAQGARDKAVC